jgi:hypothetical protein
MDTNEDRQSRVPIEGRYVREANEDSAELQVKLVGKERIHVSGLALWGKTQSRGPNLGQLEFEAPLESRRKATFTDSTYRLGSYRLSLQFAEEGLIAEETPAPGYFGLNVSFAGQFRRL